MFNVCDERLRELARRKEVLSRRIEVQRRMLEDDFQRFRAPLRTLDSARSMGARVVEHGPFVAMLLAPVLFVLRRPLVGAVGFAARSARKVMRWWGIWKLGSKIVSGMPAILKRQEAR